MNSLAQACLASGLLKLRLFTRTRIQRAPHDHPRVPADLLDGKVPRLGHFGHVVTAGAAGATHVPVCVCLFEHVCAEASPPAQRTVIDWHACSSRMHAMSVDLLVGFSEAAAPPASPGRSPVVVAARPRSRRRQAADRFWGWLGGLELDAERADGTQNTGVVGGVR